MADRETEPGTPENIVASIVDALWPDGNPDFEWSPDTLNEIADILTARGYGPDSGASKARWAHVQKKTDDT